MENCKRSPAHNILWAIMGLTVVNSTFVILSGICANVGLTISKCPTIAKPETVSCYGRKTLKILK
jgi:hypothetical protein